MDILNLVGWRVSHVDERTNTYHITAELTTQPFSCPKCGVINAPELFGTRTLSFVDLPIHGKQVTIKAIRQRYRCRDCRSTFTLVLNGVDEKRHISKRLKYQIETLSLQRTFASLSADIGVDEKTIRNIFRDYARELESKFRFETPEKLGIDEVHLLGKARNVMSNLTERTIIEMLPSRNKPAISKYFMHVPDRNKIKIVCMDMWNPYREVITAMLPDAEIVIDKFHVVRMANDALEKVRKQLRLELSDKQRVGLMHDRFVLLRRKRDLKEKDLLLLDVWTSAFPIMKQAYEAKEKFFNIWDTQQSRADAEKQYDEWSDELPQEIQGAFGDVTRAVKNWRGLIFNYFDYRITNAVTETLNGLTKQMNRQGRGYSFAVIRAKMLFANRVREPTQPPLFEPEPKIVDQKILEKVVKLPQYGVAISTIEQRIYGEGLFGLSTTKSG